MAKLDAIYWPSRAIAAVCDPLMVLPAGGSVTLIVLAGAGGVGPGALTGKKAWLWSALASGPFLFAAGVTLVSGLLLVIVGAFLWRVGAAGRRKPNRGQDGSDQ